MINKKLMERFNKKISVFLMAIMMLVFTTLLATSALALDTTHPTILSVSPNNNEMSIGTHDVITVMFNEPMDARTINKDTFIVVQRTTPTADSQLSAFRSVQRTGIVTYNGLTATFTPTKDQQNPLQPSQQYGNVFTVTITTGAQDLAGNALAQDYMWSFTTGSDFFNRGATTSQQDQSSALSTSSTQVPVVAAVTSAQDGNNNQYPWLWIIGGVFLLLLIPLIFALSRRKHAPQKNSKAAHTTPFGDVHPVLDLEGIGPVYNKGLQAMGIKNTQQLWAANANKVASETGAPLSSVQSWQQMAELAAVKDIGPQYAELLERSGVHSIEQLKNYDATALLKRVRNKQNSLQVNIQGNTPGQAMVENWIDQARDHKFSAAEKAVA